MSYVDYLCHVHRIVSISLRCEPRSSIQFSDSIFFFFSYLRLLLKCLEVVEARRKESLRLCGEGGKTKIKTNDLNSSRRHTCALPILNC